MVLTRQNHSASAGNVSFLFIYLIIYFSFFFFFFFFFFFEKKNIKSRNVNISYCLTS